ncbi:MAG: redoxin domain-containing protein [Candidatus Hydrogenedentes bacterium]|nr:redoxin domain-containing protein [Candidatus Hydrogenedentota bacterium]
MKSIRCRIAGGWAVLALCTATSLAATRENPAEAKPLPAIAKNFRLEDHLGGSHELYRMKDGKAIVLYFHGNGCPIVRKSIPEIKAIRDEFNPKGVGFFMINANPLDDKDSIVEEAKEFAIDIPILMDTAQIVTLDLGTKRTAEAIVIVPDGWKIVYRGAISDRQEYGFERPKPDHDWLRDALNAVLEGREPEVKTSETKGCLIDLKEVPTKVSYARHIAPILEEKCVSCHVEGHIGPFAMDSYENVAGRKRMIREVLVTKRMPPWHADPYHGEFKNDNSLTEKELRTMVAWLDSDAGNDAKKDPLLRFAVDDAEPVWPLGTPDVIIPMPKSVDVPADGVLDYVYMRVPYTGDEDLWITAADVLPGDRSVVHHALVFLNYPNELKNIEPDMEGGLNGFFAGYVPGMLNEPYPKGTGKWVPKGSEFVFQMHYTTTGRAASDRSQLGLYLAKKKPAREFFTRAATNTDFEIKPNDPKSPTDATYRFDRDVVLYEMGPHMHYRGKEVSYEVRYPDGNREMLLNVPNYDFNWQTMYRLDKPLHLPAGSQLRVAGAFDNSARNPRNPDPNRAVYFGEQSWDEMFVGYIGYAYVDAEAAPVQTVASNIHFGKPVTAENLVGTFWRIGRWKLNFQENGVLRVGRTFKGTWQHTGNGLHLRVAGDEFDLEIQDDTILSEDGPLEYLADHVETAPAKARLSSNQ